MALIISVKFLQKLRQKNSTYNKAQIKALTKFSCSLGRLKKTEISRKFEYNMFKYIRFKIVRLNNLGDTVKKQVCFC